MSDEVKQDAEPTVEQKIESQINNQQPAVSDSEWADPPEFSEVQEKQLADAAQKAAGAVEFDDTSHTDGAGDGAEQPKPAPPEPTVKEPVDDEIPAGESVRSKPAEEVAQNEDQAQRFDPILLNAAGLTKEEAVIQFGTPTALENAVRMLDQRSVSIADMALQQYLASRQHVPAETQTRTPAPAETEFKMPDPPEGEEWDETTVALVRGLQQQFTAKLQEQQAVLERQQVVTQSFLEERNNAELRRYVNEFDGFVNGLGEEWAPLLGKGSGFEIKPDGIEMKSRVHLDTVAKQLAFGRAQQGNPELPRQELLARALRVAFPQKQEQVVRKQVEKEVSKRQAMVTNRPGGRAGGLPKSGVDAAADRAEKWYAARGMATLPADDFNYDEI